MMRAPRREDAAGHEGAGPESHWSALGVGFHERDHGHDGQVAALLTRLSVEWTPYGYVAQLRCPDRCYWTSGERHTTPADALDGLLEAVIRFPMGHDSPHDAQT